MPTKVGPWRAHRCMQGEKHHPVAPSTHDKIWVWKGAVTGRGVGACADSSDRGLWRTHWEQQRTFSRAATLAVFATWQARTVHPCPTQWHIYVTIKTWLEWSAGRGGGHTARGTHR
jgi:hypothetical protein